MEIMKSFLSPSQLSVGNDVDREYAGIVDVDKGLLRETNNFDLN